MAEGYRRRHYLLADNLRYATYLMVSPYLKNVFYPKFCSDYWPMAMDEKMMEQKRNGKPNVIDSKTWAALQKQLTLPPVSSEYEKILKTHNL